MAEKYSVMYIREYYQSSMFHVFCRRDPRIEDDEATRQTEPEPQILV